MAGKVTFWTPEKISQAVALAEEYGKDRRKVAAAMGIDYTQLDNGLRRIPELRAKWKGEDWAAEGVASGTLDPLELAERLREAYAWLSIVDLPPLPRVPVTTQAAPATLVVSDLHFPHDDPRYISIVLQVVEELKPQRLVLNGDGPDMLALSRFPKDARIGKSWGLGEEQRASKSFWRTVAEVGQSWGIELVETEANHSGNDLASRWRRYLNERVPELFDLEGFEELASYARFFHPSDVDVRLVDDVVIAPEHPSPLRILHGWKANANGGYTAKNSGDAIQGSVMVGHTHRLGESNRRVPAIVAGGETVRREHQHRRFEIGCGMLLGADYAPHADWTQGFAVIHHTARSYGVELVTVEDGRAVVGALGREVVAS